MLLLENIIKNVRPVSAALSVNGLNKVSSKLHTHYILMNMKNYTCTILDHKHYILQYCTVMDGIALERFSLSVCLTFHNYLW